MLPPFASRHNLQVWRHEPYLGFGAGAHGCAGGWRYSDVRAPRAYVRRMLRDVAPAFPFSAALADRTRLDPETERREVVMLGMRLVREGVSESVFEQRFGLSLRKHFAHDWQELASQRLVEWAGDRVRLTPRGRLLANRVFVHFV
jgi:oxygen-independent coproporphyrinogen-3 oxidase